MALLTPTTLVALCVVLSATIATSATASCSAEQTSSLLAFKAGVSSDPSGLLSNWSLSASTTSDCCSWYGVACNSSTGSIAAIHLSNSSLSGVLGLNSTALSSLSSLDLSYNNFSGPIPDELSGLASLSTLLLRNNAFDGILPVGLISLAAVLTTLDVSSNQLSGEIPQAAPFTSFPSSSYEGNAGLCGSPLPACQGY